MIANLPLLKRWVPSVKKRLAALTYSDGHRIKRANGVSLLLNYKNYVDRQIAFNGSYEREQIEFLIANMRERGSDIFLDVGANFGLYALRVASSQLSSRVVAFEPDPRNYCHLCGNLYLNGLHTAVEVRQCAVSDRSGRVSFEFFPDTSTGQSRVSTAESAVQVDAVRLDDFLRVEGKRVSAKIDVEGHELNVIDGMTEVLRRNACFLQIESFEDNYAALDSKMTANGYKRIRSIGNDHYFAGSR